MPRSSPDQYGRASDDYDSAMHCRVAYPRCRHASYNYCRRTHRDGVRWTRADCHVRHARCWKSADQYRRTSWRRYRPAYVRHRTCHHRTGMHISQSCSWLSHKYDPLLCSAPSTLPNLQSIGFIGAVASLIGDAHFKQEAAERDTRIADLQRVLANVRLQHRGQ